MTVHADTGAGPASEAGRTAVGPELRADLDSALHMVRTEQFKLTALGQRYISPSEVLAETDLSTARRYWLDHTNQSASSRSEVS